MDVLYVSFVYNSVVLSLSYCGAPLDERMSFETQTPNSAHCGSCNYNSYNAILFKDLRIYSIVGKRFNKNSFALMFGARTSCSNNIICSAYL